MILTARVLNLLALLFTGALRLLPLCGLRRPWLCRNAGGSGGVQGL